MHQLTTDLTSVFTKNPSGSVSVFSLNPTNQVVEVQEGYLSLLNAGWIKPNEKGRQSNTGTRSEQGKRTKG